MQDAVDTNVTITANVDTENIDPMEGPNALIDTDQRVDDTVGINIKMLL